MTSVLSLQRLTDASSLLGGEIGGGAGNSTTSNHCASRASFFC